MSDLRKAAEMALEALMQKGEHHPKVYQAAEALRQALAQEEKHQCPWPDGECTTCGKIESKPSLWFAIHKDGNVKYTTDSARAKGWKESGAYRLVRDYYTTPPKREWVGLTDEEVENYFLEDVNTGCLLSFGAGAAYAGAKLKEKNGG